MPRALRGEAQACVPQPPPPRPQPRHPRAQGERTTGVADLRLDFGRRAGVGRSGRGPAARTSTP
eukprot:9175972-Pyramimonas_sp.AAC.1